MGLSGLLMKQARVYEVDLLRFLAALSVIFFHYAFRGYTADHLSNLPYPLLAPIAKYGYLGVELFFMISGFVILMTATHSSITDFIISRGTRLYPAFWIACTLSFLAITALGAPQFSANFSQYLGNLTLLGEFLGFTAIDGSYWSLFVEIRFYFLVLLLLALNKIRYAQALLVLWLFVSFLLEMMPIGLLRYIFITDYAAFFIAGATCFLIWAESFSVSKGLMLLSAWALSECEALNLLASMEDHYKTSFNHLAVIGIITAFFLIMFLVAKRWTGFCAHQRWLVLGAITYPLYLIHQNMGFIIFNQLYPSINPHLLFWGTILLMLVLSYIIYAVFEKPLAKKMRLFLERILNQAQISKSFSSTN